MRPSSPRNLRAGVLLGGLAAAAAAAPAPAQTLIFRGTDPVTGHSYYNSDVTVSFNTGRALAANLAVMTGQTAYLAAVNDQAEQTLINSLIGTFDIHWIGFTAEADAGGPSYAWDSGEPVTYTNWLGGAPVLGDPLRNYASLNWDGQGRWLNLREDGGPFAFKFALVELVPAPGAAGVLGLGMLAATRRRRPGL